ncbi:MAG: hypothetical protein ACP5OG_04310 [Candidatus Nanoarchaeia archaeon]
MERGWKIFLFIIGLIIIGLIAFAIITYYQFKQIMNIVNDPSLEEDLNALMKGDCSKLEAVLEKYNKIRSTVQSACKNPLINVVVQKNSVQGKDLCLEMKKPGNELEQGLSQIRDYCNKPAS